MLRVKPVYYVDSSLGIGTEPARERLAVLSFRDIWIVPHYTFRATRWVSKGLINSSALQFVWVLQSDTLHHTSFNALIYSSITFQLVTLMFSVKSQTCSVSLFRPLHKNTGFDAHVFYYFKINANLDQRGSDVCLCVGRSHTSECSLQVLGPSVWCSLSQMICIEVLCRLLMASPEVRIFRVSEMRAMVWPLGPIDLVLV